ncbi:MAG TPA: MoxR family ATPase [Candidatus Glassbacteria bacterium]|nr:MoxR family ATPase [Candidatus Glassbacteria bacterium]
MSLPTTVEITEANLREHLKKLHDYRDAILRQVRRTIVGQDEVVHQVLIVLLVGGHTLITGLPGLAKTLLVKTVAGALGLTFRRIQFTPDLMPADITGTDIIEEDIQTGHRTWNFVPGPIFANVILADEINRTPPKTQAALLEAMQEKSVTVLGKTYQLEPPFFVLATQNPIELEGTYPLPEAQLDRFLFNIVIDYLSEEEELQVVNTTTSGELESSEAVTKAAEVLLFQQLVRKVPIADSVARYAVRLTRSTRPGDGDAPDFVKRYVNYGVSVRAAQFLVLASKARALLEGRYNVSVEDIQALSPPVMRHRILTNFHAESDGIKPDEIVRRLIETVPAPKSGL